MDTLVSREAPDFTAKAVLADGTIKADFSLSSFRGKYIILLFYPMDFTFVCPSELIAFDEAREEFAKRDTCIIGVSVDSHHTHAAWRRTPRNKGGVGELGYPLVSDLRKDIARKYGVLLNEEVALRGLFLIDREGIVRHVIVNDLPLGRNVEEALRMVDALRFHEEKGEVCPANWKKGRPGMKPTQQGVVDYLSRYAPQHGPPPISGVRKLAE
jgi:peroxiredoxin (alkyl hydroperoxide reductase subunit C)